MEMRRQRLFAPLNYSGILDYCERALRLSRAQAYYFKSVAEKSEWVPQLKEAVVQGQITLSQARRIGPVITTENQQQWVADAKNLPQKELSELRDCKRLLPGRAKLPGKCWTPRKKPNELALEREFPQMVWTRSRDGIRFRLKLNMRLSCSVAPITHLPTVLTKWALS